MISVSIQGLVKRFGTTTALDGIDLQIAPGELFFLLGPSGCGKTTLLRSVAGFVIPDAGAILFDQENVTRLPPHQRQTGMMFQSYALWPHLTVAQNVAFGLEERKVPKPELQQRVGAALESVRMSHTADRKIGQLSGGQQQRVALARALVVRPRCLLLDEPLSNLDAKLRLEMRSEIRRVVDEFHLTAIYVTHDQKEALSIADRLAVLDRGKIQQAGSPREIYRRPTSKLVADFIGETNFLAGKVLSVGEGKARVQTAGGDFTGLITAPDWTPAPGAEVTISIRPESWTLTEAAESAAAATNAITGRIARSIYLGEIAQYEFVTAGGPLKIFELNPHFMEISRDRTLTATVAAEDVIILQH